MSWGNALIPYPLGNFEKINRFQRIKAVAGITARRDQKVNGEARSGSESLSVSVSKGRGIGFGHEKPGSQPQLIIAVLRITRQRNYVVHEARVPTRTGIDSDPDSDPDPDSDRDLTDRQPLPGGDV